MSRCNVTARSVLPQAAPELGEAAVVVTISRPVTSPRPVGHRWGLRSGLFAFGPGLERGEQLAEPGHETTVVQESLAVGRPGRGSV